MPNYQISAEQLAEGSIVVIRGKLGYARLTRLIEGAELAASDMRRAKNGMSPVGKPHTTATITEAQVLYRDPANPTAEERFVDERRYVSKKNPASGANYAIDSKGSNLPVIAIPTAAGDGTVTQDLSGKELAQGLDVSLVLRVYKPKNYAKRGLSLDQVIVNEPVRYYTASNIDQNELAARGIVFAAPPQQVPATAAPAAAGVDTMDVPVGTMINADGLALPAPQPAPTHTPAAAAAPAAVAAPVETMEEKIKRLEAENAQFRTIGSAVGAPAGNPWDDSVERAGISYPG